jgi:hypothetical protein
MLPLRCPPGELLDEPGLVGVAEANHPAVDPIGRDGDDHARALHGWIIQVDDADLDIRETVSLHAPGHLQGDLAAEAEGQDENLENSAPVAHGSCHLRLEVGARERTARFRPYRVPLPTPVMPLTLPR